MQVQTGIDIIEVNRIQEAIESQGKKFLQYVYTPNEISYCEQTGKMKYQHYATRFAAKEAIYKAISNKLGIGIGDIWTKIEIKTKERRKTNRQPRTITIRKYRKYGPKPFTFKRICSRKFYHTIQGKIAKTIL